MKKGMGAHMTPILTAKARPLLDAILDEAKSWELAGHPSEAGDDHAFASLSTAIRMLVRGVCAGRPGLLTTPNMEDWLHLAIDSGAAMARDGKGFEL